MSKPLSKPLNSSVLREAVFQALEEAKETGDRDSILIGFSIQQVLELADKMEDYESAEDVLDYHIMDDMVGEEEPN